MIVRLSDEALGEYERLEAQGDARFDVLRDDLALLEHTPIEGLERWAALLDLGYYLGPTGRVRYWASVDGDDVVIEFFDVDP